jgi:hypothetical protein
MNWLEQWRALSARIDGLIRAGEFLLAAFQIHKSDVFRVVSKSFQPELQAIIGEIKNLGNAHASELPEKARESLNRFVSRGWGKEENRGEVDIQALAPLAAFRSEFEYLLRDLEVERRSLVELAFEHLRRQLVVDDDVRNKWGNAYDTHETACEKLGAVHLLAHGVWAFKVQAPGAATDLVFGDPIEKHSVVVRQTARALVLTEWKVVRDSENLMVKAQEARDQTQAYSTGVLGDIELKGTRYIVLVCGQGLEAPTDVKTGALTYRHIVIPIRPESPSVAARRKTIQRLE